MKIAVVGSRDFAELDRVRRYVMGLPAGVIIVSGGARGVDRIAEKAARERGLQVIVFYANWERDGRGAGMARNTSIVATADKVVAFWDGQSRGTKNTIDKANAAGKPVEIITVSEPEKAS